MGERPQPQVQLKIRLYSSVAPGISRKHARAATRPMLNLLQEKLGCVIDFGFVEGDSAEDLLRFGKEINEGTVHLGVIWGLEYGWLRARWPQLKPLVVCAQTKNLYESRVMVREGFGGKSLADLADQRLARYRGASLMDRMYLDKLLKDNNHTESTYFHEVKDYPTAKSAILAVRNNEADCLVVNMVAYARHVTTGPKLKLDYLLPSKPFPEAVLVGRPDRIDGLRRGLWAELQKSFETIHRTAEGRECVDFWMIEQFSTPGDSFEQLVRDRLRDYPITALERLAPVGQRR
jgi:ABC-type phosphate/phosphonate transport system substrate-binding protein